MGLGTQVFDRELADHDRGRGHLRPHVHQLLAELPRLAAARPASRVDGAARAGASAVVGSAVLTKMVDASIWFRDVILPREARRLAKAAEAGKLDSRTRLESLREASAHLQYAARAWYAAAGEPAINGFAIKATG